MVVERLAAKPYSSSSFQFWEVALGERLPFQFAIEEGGIVKADTPKELLRINCIRGMS